MPRRGLFIAFLVLLAGASVFAQYRVGPRRSEQSRSVVGNYCRMDYEGLRLTKESWPRMKLLTTWKENPYWQGFTIVSQYDLLSANDGLRSATVEVQYSILGHFEPGIGFVADPRRELVIFRLKDVDSAWKIDQLDPPINPHVSRPRAIAWLKSALAAEKDRANRLAIEKALKDLGGNPAITNRQ
jgi:hypothetical protein